MKNPPKEILTPLNLPKRETSDPLNKETSERYSPPLEGLGEVIREVIRNLFNNNN